MRPIRILHVLEAMNHGGVQVFLMNVLRHIDRTAYRFDFAVHIDRPAAFDSQIRKLGSRALLLPPPRQAKLSYGKQFAHLLRSEGPFDVVHSHVHYFSGSVLRAAAACGVPVRIAHSHIDTRRLDRDSSVLRKGYLWVMRRWIDRYATCGLAASEFAAAALFGDNWLLDRRWRIVRYGIDFSQFAELPDRRKLREQFGIPPGRYVLGQVGRLDSQKNHQFTIRVLQELTRTGADVHLLLVGAGELEREIRSRLQAAGLLDRAFFAGAQDDIRPFLAVMDCKIFPSTHEGLGIVALEAQAAGVPTVASDQVPPDARVIPDLMEFLPLEAGPGAWAEAVKRRFAQPRHNSQATSARLAESDFAVERSIARLTAVYRGFTDLDG